MKSLHMTKEQAEAHQRKHGFLTAMGADPLFEQAVDEAKRERLLKPSRSMNKTEHEFSLILESRRQKGEILSWKFEAVRLKWGEDPRTKAAMWYKPDFLVTYAVDYETHDVIEAGGWRMAYRIGSVVMEVKGPHIFSRDMVRFKGCRAEWPQFIFEMHQRDREGRWTQIA